MTANINGMGQIDSDILDVNIKLSGVNDIITKMSVFSVELVSELKKLTKHHRNMKDAKIVKMFEYLKTKEDIIKIKECLAKTKQDCQQANNQKKKIEDELKTLERINKSKPPPATAKILQFRVPSVLKP